MSERKRLEVAIEAALAAGSILRELMGKVAMEFKGEIDVVTEADRRAEEAIISRLRRAFPGEGIWAEESGRREGEGQARWLIDPLDGTSNYAHGLPIFAVSIAAEVDGELEVGVVYDPCRDELFTAARGGGAWLNGRPLRVSGEGELRRSLLVTGFPYDVRVNEENNLDHFTNFTFSAQAVRRLGSAALDLAYVAAGRFDGYWETRLNPWDMAAGVLLVLEAGGRVTDLLGRPWRLEGRQVLASNGRIHEAMQAVLTQGRSGMGGAE